jgi:NAD(P)-dependent dehydrogenase (short-subunit alcohol dehydrogenase family)
MSEPVAIITGGAGDLARAMAKVFDEHGFKVHSPGKEELDVTGPAGVRTFFSQHERVDLLINNAGAREDSTS